jgi:hypothetical protein
MPQPVGLDSPETGLLRGISHYVAHATGTEVPMWRFDSNKYCSPLGARRTAMLQILGHCAADIRGQRDTFEAVCFAAHDDFTGSPVDIVQPELRYFARPQTETDQNGQNGDVPATAPRRVVT